MEAAHPVHLLKHGAAAARAEAAHHARAEAKSAHHVVLVKASAEGLEQVCKDLVGVAAELVSAARGRWV